MQDIIQMCSFDASKSTKGASKLRRDLINTEIGHLRDLLPLPASTRQRLSQLQLMALVCVYVRKANYFQQVFKRHDLGHMPTPSIGFSKAMNGFLMMMTQNGKLLYISDNAAEYLGHSMEDLLIHGDSVYDIIDKQDHQNVQNEMGRPPVSGGVADDARIFLCRMNVSRNARRQMRFGDQKVILVEGHFVSYLPLCTRNEPVLIATCTPVAMPETRECVVQGATNIFTTVHCMDMKFASIDASGEFYLGYSRQELLNISWYQLLHWDFMREAQSKHRLITQSEQDRSCILLIRLQRRNGTWLWVHCVLQVKDATETGQQPVIICTNQILSDREAEVMRANSWLYHYYLVQSKLQFGMAYEGQQQATAAANSRSSASAASPGYYAPLMASPGPSASSCSASGEPGGGGGGTPQPPHFIGGLVPAPLTSPHYGPVQHQQHPHGHPHHHYPLDSGGYHFPISGPSNVTATSSSLTGNQNTTSGSHYAFSPSPGSSTPTGHYPNSSYPSAGTHQPYHHQHQHIKTEAYHSPELLADRAELSGYHIKIEAKSDDFHLPGGAPGGIDASGSIGAYGELNKDEQSTSHHHPHRPPGASEEEPMSPASSPPRKRYRVMATSLPGTTPPSAYHPASGGSDHHHHHPHHSSSGQQHQHQQPNSAGYGQSWPSNTYGWINTSYPVGLAQLDDRYDGEGVADESSSFSSIVAGISASRISPSSAPSIHRRSLFRHKAVLSGAMDSADPVRPYHYAMESAAQVPDFTTVTPELSPLGYVLTPAPTPPDAQDAPGYQHLLLPTASHLEMEQRAPAPSASSNPHPNIGHDAPVDQPAVTYHHLYAPANPVSTATRGAVSPVQPSDSVVNPIPNYPNTQ